VDYTSISASSRSFGKLSVKGIYPYGEHLPAVLVMLQYDLKYLEPDHPGTLAFKHYFLTDIYGELRLSQYNDCAVRLYWGSNHQAPYVGTHQTDGQVELVGELAPAILDRIERWRNGKPPKFWIKVWPSFASKEAGWFHNVQSDPFQCEVKHEDWFALLDKVGHGRQELVEVPFSDVAGTDYKDALGYVARARKAFLEGRHEECGYNCREALNRVAQAVRADEAIPDTAEGKRPHLDLFLKGVQEGRAKAIREIFVQMNRIGDNATHSLHPMGQAEARFTLQTTVGLMALLGDLTRKRA
jgi:hypothetical protein